MGSSDRDYNRSGGGEDYFANPASILALSVPFGSWFGVRVRLHFWLLLTFVISLVSLTRGGSLTQVLIGIALTLIALLIHDFGHRIFAHRVGGQHDEFMLWPIGGMIFPTVPPGAWPLFVASVGGIVANLCVGSISFFVAELLGRGFHLSSLLVNPLSPLGSGVDEGLLGQGREFVAGLLVLFALINWGLILANFLPYYWFDGGFLLQSFLWPFLGAYGAINVTCIIGMIFAVPMFFLALSGGALMGMIFWTLLFSSAYSRRKQLQAEGTNELEGSIAWSAQNRGDEVVKPKRRWMQPNYAKKAATAAAKARKEQDEIDAILAKVSSSGMNSLTRGERKALERATQKQRER